MIHGQESLLQIAAGLSVRETGTDARRFEAFSHEQYPALLRFLRLRMRNEEDARDATQESLMRLMRYRDNVPDTDWRPLLYRIAVNVANEWFRRASARHFDKCVPLEDVELVSPEPTQEELIEREQQEALLEAAILALPVRCRQIYLLSRMQGMTYMQIATHCGISVKTVEKHMSQALAILYETVGKGVGGAL